MKKKFLISLALIFLTPYAFSQDKKAETILKDVSAKTKSYKSIHIDFTMISENKASSKKELREGSLLNKGDKYKLNLAGQTVISDGKTVWTYIKDANEVQINSVGENDDAFTPSRLLSSYTENYKTKFAGDKQLEGKAVYFIDLTPLKKGKSFTRVRLTVDKIKSQLMNVAVYNKDGSTFTYKIKKFITNQPVAESEFLFKAGNYPGVEIIDMR